MKRSVDLAVIYLMTNLIIGGLAVTSEYQACFRIDGAALEASFRCDNGTAGHSSCCMAGQVCWSNGVCHGKTHGVDDWLRIGCTDYSWRDTACFDVCPWSVGGTGIGVRACGGIDKSNRYCCDDGSTGDGSFACCNNDTQIFEYNNITTLPTIIATIPLDGATSTSSSIIQSTRNISTSTQTTTVVVTNSAASANSGGSFTVAVGVGLGVGLPAVAAILSGAGLMIWRSRRNQPNAEQSPQYDPPDSPGAPSFSNTSKLPSVRGQSVAIIPQELSLGHDARELPG
ncbi:hypothetical protein F5B19DRAFT_197940 [Rostrohypoxylon terebratum]|nr:hypothetical protein F5B19DRAFT_197940 [Rostrohypoxylon terebratum]